jgi:hypothetical protein
VLRHTDFTQSFSRAAVSIQIAIGCWALLLPAHGADIPPQGKLHKVALKADPRRELTDEVQRRAFRFFEEKTDPVTGLTQDRARNDGLGEFPIASIASTGYALAALPIAVERGWLDRAAAEDRARRTLKFLRDEAPRERGFFYHFSDMRTGARAWKSELSSLDSTLLFCGALTAGQYFGGEIEQLANTVYERADWPWMLTNGGANPAKLSISHGWTPERGFLTYDYGAYSEAMLVYLLGMGAEKHTLPSTVWKNMRREIMKYGGTEAIAGGPIFIHQMPHNFFSLRNRRDSCGFDYWVSSTNATLISRSFCMDRMKDRRSYGPDFWSLNASDGPSGYRAYGALELEDGTISPTGAIASIIFTPELSLAAAEAMHREFGSRLWGRYGFGNAYNVDRDWYGAQVIGIDLGMAMLAIENSRTGLIWRLLESHPAAQRAFQAAGLETTSEDGTRVLHVR